jgi:hypothetical protein
VDVCAVESIDCRVRVGKDQRHRAEQRRERKPMRDRALRRLEEQVDQQDCARRAEQEVLGQQQEQVVDVERHFLFPS